MKKKTSDAAGSTSAPGAATPMPKLSPDPHPARFIKDPRSAAAVKQYARADWPRIGGRQLAETAPDAFLQPAFLDRYAPGELAFVYSAGTGEDAADPAHATGTLGLGRSLWVPVYKLSASRADDLRVRMMELNVDLYAAMVRINGQLVEEPGFDNWTLQQLHPKRQPSPNSPVAATARALRITLPRGVSLQVFEKTLHERLGNAALHNWLSTPDGAAHCREIGINPAIGKRMTRYSFGAGERLSRAEELYIFRPRVDADRLVTICESIVLQFVTGGLPSPEKLEAWRSCNQGYRPPR